jgi:hypothetical protein
MHVAAHLPAIECTALDEKSGIDGAFTFLHNVYLQPALKQPLLFPDEI